MLKPPIAAAGLALLLAAPAARPAMAVDAAMTPSFQQHVSIHVPRMTVTTTTIVVRESPAVEERRAKSCVEVGRIQGFTVNAADSVDLILEDGSLLRAKLGAECPALGFYSGAYLKPTKDAKFCAGRDALRSRSGRTCPVQAFKTLVRAR